MDVRLRAYEARDFDFATPIVLWNHAVGYRARVWMG